MKKILSFILLACCAVPMMAQWQMQPTPNDTLQPVRNLGDGKVAYLCSQCKGSGLWW